MDRPSFPALAQVYGTLLIVRPPVPATCNKAGANYKSEVTHLNYSPRRAYDEWLGICDAILQCGGDALFLFEDADRRYLDRGDLHINASGDIFPEDSTEWLGNMNTVMTGRVFAANGPWVTIAGSKLRALMPHMLPHRHAEGYYYGHMLQRIAELGEYELEVVDNPHPWEGMADVAVVGDKVVLTHAVQGHYDAGVGDKTVRTSLDGARFAADYVGATDSARVFAELVYPHFHGDTVHFGARPTAAPPTLAHYAGGLWGDSAERVGDAVPILPISRIDAVDEYAANSRQVGDGVLIPDGCSAEFEAALTDIGLTTHRVDLFELFGKAGGGPACATLYMPSNLQLPKNADLRYSVRRDDAHARRERIPANLSVDPGFFEGKQRG